MLAVEGEYGTLVLTDRSAEVLRGDTKMMMRREATPTKTRLPRARAAARCTSSGAAIRGWRTTSNSCPGNCASTASTTRAAVSPVESETT